MSYFLSAYDTTVGGRYVMDNVNASIQKLLILDNNRDNLCSSVGIKPINGIRHYAINNTSTRFTDIPVFSHPYMVNFNNEKYLCTDYRHVLDSDNNVRNTVEFNFTRLKTILALKWYSQREKLRVDLSFVSSVYSAWFSDTISKRYMLDPRDQMLLMIMADYYFQSLFLSESPTEDDKQKFAIHTMNIFKAPSSMIFSTYDKMGGNRDINEFCSDVVKVLENPRLHDFNAGVLITILANTWYGVNAKDNISIAIEYPPIMTAIVYSALVEKSYRNAIISKITDRYSKNGHGNQFLETLEVMLDDSIAEGVVKC